MINVKVAGYNPSAPIIYYISLPDGNSNFPLYTIGHNSYIDGYGGYIRTSIEQDYNAKREWYVHNIQIGNYTSIATEVSFCVGSNHNYRALSNSGAGSHPPQKYSFVNQGQIIIQNDVWIGYNATIMGGVTVRNGAVIAANSHVIKDVPPYAIVGGNPARVIKYRFSENVIKKLQLIRWWHWSDEKKSANQKYMDTYDIESFCQKFYPEALDEKNNVPPPSYLKSVRGKNSYLYFVDLNTDFPLWKRVVKIFNDLHLPTRGGGRETCLSLHWIRLI